MDINFGVDSFIWTENFSEKDLWIIKKAEELGFQTLDFAIAHPENFPTEKVIEELEYDKEMSAKYSTGLREQGHIEAFDEAISIAKRGGINNILL